MSTKDVDLTSSQSRSAKADEFLWSSFRQGSSEAFEVIYKRYANSMFNYGMHLFLDKVLVEDSIQDVFVDLWKRKEFLGDTTSIKFYLLKALKRKVLRKLTTSDRKDMTEMLSEDFPALAHESIESLMIKEQSSNAVADAVKKAVDSLPDRQRQIIEHRFYQDLSPQEISQNMKLSIDSTYTLLSRAIRELRKNLKKL
jgi:RNA polymerase sigma factor (sigma-70 family)